MLLGTINCIFNCIAINADKITSTKDFPCNAFMPYQSIVPFISNHLLLNQCKKMSTKVKVKFVGFRMSENKFQENKKQEGMNILNFLLYYFYIFLIISYLFLEKKRIYPTYIVFTVLHQIHHVFLF